MLLVADVAGSLCWLLASAPVATTCTGETVVKDSLKAPVDFPTFMSDVIPNVADVALKD